MLGNLRQELYKQAQFDPALGFTTNLGKAFQNLGSSGWGGGNFMKNIRGLGTAHPGAMMAGAAILAPFALRTIQNLMGGGNNNGII